MSVSPFPSSPDQPTKYEESFMSLQNDNRVLLPEDQDTSFEENQSFDQSWIWILLGVVTLIVFILLLMPGHNAWAILFGGTVLGFVMALMSSIRLHTRIDEIGIHYRVHPFFWKEKSIPWRDMDQVYVRQYSPLLEYGGWGIRYGGNGWAYNVKGNQGIQIVRKNGSRILIGTQRPEDVANEIGRRMITV